MKNNLPGNLRIPALFGILFYIGLFLGRNSDLLNDYPILHLFGISVLVVSLYALVFGIIKNPLNLAVGTSGFKIAAILIVLLLPFGVFVYQKFYYKPEKQYKSLLEKEQIAIIPNGTECIKNKYGVFTNGYDTIIRFKRNNVDYEQIKSFKKEEALRIKWVDSCVYYAVKNNGLLVRIERLGNFKYDETFEQYSKPAAIHEISEERILLLKKIK